MTTTCKTEGCSFNPIPGEEKCIECLIIDYEEEDRKAEEERQMGKPKKRYTWCTEKKCTTKLRTEEEIVSGICDSCYHKHTHGDDDGTDGVVVIPSVASPICTHYGNPLVFEIGKGKVYAGGSKSDDEWDLNNVDLIFNLEGPPTYIKPVVSMQEEARQYLAGLVGEYDLDGSVGVTPRVFIDWKDGSAPPVGLKYFEEIARLVDDGTNVMVHCMGGHGRTGTALLAIAKVAGILPKDDDPLVWLRTIYCQKAVETTSQVSWLAAHKIYTQEKPTYAFHSYTKGSTTGNTGNGTTTTPTKTAGKHPKLAGLAAKK